MTAQYGQWPESHWTSTDIDPNIAKLVTAGVDVGTVSTQAVVLCDDAVYGYSNIRTSPDAAASAEEAVSQALGKLKLDQVPHIVATGAGRQNAKFAHKQANEINCHAKGARFMYGPSVTTVVDLGGHTTKAIKLYKWDRVLDFTVNDKCATGMGRAIEIMADLMQVPITEMGERSLSVKEDPEPVSTTCYVFANTEAIGLLRSNKVEEALAAYLFAVAYRIYPMVGRIKPEKELAFTGGLAKNPGVVKRLEREMGMTALTSKYDPQLAGAIGAALLARELVR